MSEEKILVAELIEEYQLVSHSHKKDQDSSEAVQEFVARICAHKDAEFAKEREQLRALIAMQAESLNTLVGGRPEGWDADGWFTLDDIAAANEALSASAESVAAWEAEFSERVITERNTELMSMLKAADQTAVRLPAGLELLLGIALEPLRREVAMLRKTIANVDLALYHSGWEESGSVRKSMIDAIDSAKATAEAYERELKARALEEAGDWEWTGVISRDEREFVKGELKEAANRLRAHSAQHAEV